MSYRRTTAYLGILLAVIAWGFSFLSIKVCVAVIPPMTLALARFVIAVAILWALKAAFAPAERLAKEDAWLMGGTGMMGMTVYFFLENHGMKRISASEASILMATIPVFTLLAERVWYAKAATWIQMLGVAISLVGVALVVQLDGPAFGGSGSWAGYAMILGAAISWVFYGFMTRPLNRKYSDLSIVFYQSLFGTIGFIPFVPFEWSQLQPVSAGVILNVFYLGIFCSALAYFLYVYSLKELGVSVCAVFINLIPLVSVIGGYCILDERLTWLQTFGGLLVLGAVYLTLAGDKERRQYSASPLDCMQE